MDRLGKSIAAFRRILNEGRAAGRRVLKITRTHSAFYFFLLVWQSFVRNRCLVRASSLAYTTLLAMIPVLAVAFSVATNFLAKDGEEGQQQVEQLIEHFVSIVAPMLDLEVIDDSDTPIVEDGDLTNPQETILSVESGAAGTAQRPVSRRTEVARSIHEYINNINSKTIGVTSLLALILVAVLLFRSIEATFNDIWGVKKGRGWFASLVHYWTSLTLGPILLILAIGVSSSSHFSRSLEWVRELDGIGSVVLFSISWFLYVVACSVLYKVMPKTEVQVRSALVGGLVAGFLLQMNNKLSFLYISNVANADRVYGSLGAFPMLLLGLYISWIILLFGAQVAYAFQNYQSYMQEKQADRIHHAGREFLALRLMALVSDRFVSGANPPKIQDLADQLGVASGLTTEVMEQLEENQLVNPIQSDQVGYLPARPPEAISVDDVLVAIRRGQGIGVVSSDDDLREVIRSAYEQVEAESAKVSRGLSMADFANAAADTRKSRAKEPNVI